MNATEFVERLDGVKGAGPGAWIALCPAHEDRNPSLSIGVGDDERVLLNCHAGCSLEEIVAAVNLPMSALFSDPPNGNGKKEIAATYDYEDEAGKLLFQVVRFFPKDFRQRRPDGNGDWDWRLGDTRRVPYQLPKVVEAVAAGKMVGVVEGERDCEAAEREGFTATCNPGGAGKWKTEYSEALRGAKVWVIADRDEPGRKHAAEVAQSLDGIATAVKIKEPAEGKDLSDHLAAGFSLKELVTVTPTTLTVTAPKVSPDVVAPPKGRRVELTAASAIQSERVRWLEPERIPLRGMVVLAGEKGLGKSIYTNAYLPAKLTRGELDGELKGTAADVLVASAEDDWGAVVKPRLMAHGADLSRVHRVRALDGDGQVMLTLPEDVELLEDELDIVQKDGRRIAMLVIDPVGAFLTGSTDSHKDADVRRALAPLAAMAERRDLAVVVVAHLTKDESRRLISRVSGSGAFVNAARSVLGFARHPDDPDGERGGQRVLIHAASNWGVFAPTLGLQVESRLVEVDDGSTADVGHLSVTGEIELGVEDLQRGSEESGTGIDEEIAVALKDGAMQSREVKAAVERELGCSRKTVERAAKRLQTEGKLVIDSGGFPRTTKWELPSSDTPVQTNPETPGVATGRNGVLEPDLGAKPPDLLETGVATEGNRATEPNLSTERPSSDIRDSLPARVATEAEEAEAARLAERFGEEL